MATALPRRIDVCVLTYKRPSMLDGCLASLNAQQRGDFDYSIVVIDNDAARSAQETVAKWARRSPLRIEYAVEPEQNISRARNRAVATSDGDYIAFIDDDESAESEWLFRLYTTCQKFEVDGVLGPVLPKFDGTPPGWLVESGLCMRRSFATGTPLLSSTYMRTGNVLFSRELVRKLDAPFDPRLGRSGGEDADFFERMLRAKRSFVWCDEARVHEHVPADRQTLRYHLRRAIMRGVTEADRQNLISVGTVKSVLAAVLYAAAIPVLFLVRYALFARYLVRCCDHVAKLLAHCGIRLGRVRSF
jgi:succinoglycan biosynthesis protein ExoM